jgi:hypothetical protein
LGRHFSFKFLAVFLLFTAAFFGSINRARAQNIFDPLVFNWQFYLDVNADLRPAGIVDKGGAQWHWQYYGRSEGRRSAPGFNVRDYLALYADLRAAFGNTNYPAAVNHFLNYGHNEGRVAVTTCPAGYALSSAKCLLPPGTMSLAAAVTTTYQGFMKTVYSFPLPANARSMTGLRGTLSTLTSGSNPSEALFLIGHVPTGACLANGSQYTDYGALFAAMPGAVLTSSFILKSLGGGANTIATNIDFPSPVNISGCVFVIMDGGPSLGYLAPINWIENISSLKLKFATTATTPAPYVIGTGDEFCFGMTWGCQLHSTSQGVTFSSVTRIPRTGRLISLFGNVSEGAITTPAGAWSARNAYYIDRGCHSMAPGLHGPGNYFATIPATATILHDFTMSGSGMSLQRTINVPMSIPVNAGDCLVHLAKVNGTGQVDAENQVRALIQP